ncbi:glycosyltransferase family 4 protein [Prevotella rectalis]|uniref:glycosyltransferase family 4 protein n=1 Tax=Prevotella rectalis TaxID=2219999 RepID=UPI0010316C06|nr:glycosyltransferase family 4 protein [Prevotella brunnea]
MNILFLTMGSGFRDVNVRGIYTDLLRRFMKDNHQVYVIYPNERRTGLGTTLNEEGLYHALGVKTLNVQKTNVLEKGLGQVLLERQFKRALKKFFGHVKFDLILYSTPPITLTKVVRWAKRHNPAAMTYLMLKDIFPQNAVDLGMLRKTGLRGLLYRFFREKEKEFYRISDWIGCMSPANVAYVLKHNPEVDAMKVEICPNSYDIPSAPLTSKESVPQREEVKRSVRVKYDLPIDKPIFIYGGNMGKPQGIPFLIECMEANKHRKDCHFLIVGNGYDYPLLETWYNANKPEAVSLFKRLPKADYDRLVDSCDIGMIFLDHRFTIPNYPSRLLPYLMERKPILACTDPNCDMGKLAVKNGYGMFCESNDVNAFTCAVDELLRADLSEMGDNAYRFYLDNYTVDHTYNTILKHLA